MYHYLVSLTIIWSCLLVFLYAKILQNFPEAVSIYTVMFGSERIDSLFYFCFPLSFSLSASFYFLLSHLSPPFFTLHLQSHAISLSDKNCITFSRHICLSSCYTVKSHENDIYRPDNTCWW